MKEEVVYLLDCLVCEGKMNKLKISICIPTYNGAPWIRETLCSVLSQNYQNFEIIVSDDASTDNTIDIIKSFDDKRIRIFRNKENLGYGKNLQKCYEKATGDIIFLMGHDDILLKNTLLKVYHAFKFYDEVGVVTRPYYWFWDDYHKPIRIIQPYTKEDKVISIFDGEAAIKALFQSAGQLSGLAFRKRYMESMNARFHEDVFTAHIYPFAILLKKYRAYYLSSYTVAVRTPSSMSRHKPDIYTISPTLQWIKMFNIVYAEKEFEGIRKKCINFIAQNYEGLIQIKANTCMKQLLKEINLLLYYRPYNAMNINFWFFSLLTILVPGRLLRRLVDIYKLEILRRKLKSLQI